LAQHGRPGHSILRRQRTCSAPDGVFLNRKRKGRVRPLYILSICTKQLITLAELNSPDSANRGFAVQTVTLPR